MWEIRKAKVKDLSAIRALAEVFNLDSEDMRAEEFKVAVDGKDILAIGRLKPAGEVLELCSLGVVQHKQKEGIGKLLVKSLLKSAKKDIYLATIIPDYFKPLGFKVLDFTPDFMKKKADWCEGCHPERCTIMKWDYPN
jgi:N-acetylglutamate synthase-like GNAT family acetyltransferase